MPPSTIDTFRTILKAADVLANYQDNIRANTVQIQTSFHSGPGPLQGNLPATQQALRDFGNAALAAIAPLNAAFVAFPTQLTAAAVAPLPLLTDLTAAYNLLHTWATNMSTVVLTTAADLDNDVTALLAAIPARVLPF